MPYVDAKMVDLVANGLTAADIRDDHELRATLVDRYGNPFPSYRTLRRWVLYVRQGIGDPESGSPGVELEVTSEEMESVFKLIKDNPMTAEDLSEEMDRSKSTVIRIIGQMEDAGYNITTEQHKVQASTKTSLLRPDVLPDRLFDAMRIRFGVLADTHAGSTQAQRTHLRSWLAYARESGVDVFFHGGDLTAGVNGYAGQDIDLYLRTADEQVEACHHDFEIQDNEKWFIIGGNHDFWHLKHGRTDPVWRFCQKYTNVYYLGYDLADVPLMPEIGLRLWHPSGAAPYSNTYRIQKGMEAMAFEQINKLTLEQSEENPILKVLLAGHIHIDAKTHVGGVLGIQVPCFEGRTNYLKRKSLYPQVGAYIVELYLNDAGNIQRSVSTHDVFVPIENDYKDYPEILLHQPDRIEYVFNGNGS